MDYKLIFFCNKIRRLIALVSNPIGWFAVNFVLSKIFFVVEFILAQDYLRHEDNSQTKRKIKLALSSIV